MLPWFRAPLDARTHESRPINSIAQPRPARIQTPDKWHAIGNEVIHGGGNLTKVRVVAAQSDNMSVCKINRISAATPHKLLAMQSKLRVARRDERSPNNLKRSGRLRHAGKGYTLSAE